MSDYEEQANKFLLDTKTKMYLTLIGYKKGYFGKSDDLERPIYRVTLINKKHRYLFHFGQSIANKHLKPTNYDVLSSITKYEPEDYENFCAGYGYEPLDEYGRENKESKRIYKKVCIEYKNVAKLWTELELETLREIQ